MKPEEALNHPKVNVFDIIHTSKNDYTVHTHYKEGETLVDYIKRHNRNVEKAKQLKSKSQA